MNPRPQRSASAALSSTIRPGPFAGTVWSGVWARAADLLNTRFLETLVIAFIAYYVAGRFGQATTRIRSSNLGPVWPAYGIALATFLAYGCRVWPGTALAALVVALQGGVPPLAAAGQTVGAVGGAMTGVFLLRWRHDFDPTLSRLRDAILLIVLGAFASALVSSGVGMLSLYATGIQAYAGLGSAWLIYWLGDSTGVLLVTPLVFTLPGLFDSKGRSRISELITLLALLTAACFVIFGDMPFLPIRLHILAFAVLPFVMWGAINFGIGGAALTVFCIATLATILTAFGFGPFATNSPFVNAVLLDVLFGVLSVSGLPLAAVVAERERVKTERERLIREQSAMEARLRLAAIVESSEDAIMSEDLNGIILSWNRAARRIFGFTEAEAVGQPITMIVPPELREEERNIIGRLRAGERIVHLETTRLTKAGESIHVALSISPIRDAAGTIVGGAKIVRDISVQKRAEQALSSVNRRLIEAQEQERSRIGRELHDDIGQRLALLTAQLSASPSDVGDNAAVLHAQAAEIASDVQALSHELHSAKLELLGIATNMRLFCKEFAERQQATVDFEARNLPDQLPANLSLGLFRVLQEALHNSAKHSGASHFEVRLSGGEGAIQLSVADRGAGFDVKNARAGRGIGLITMEERMKLIGGDLAIESEPQRGTTVRASVPFSPSADRRPNPSTPFPYQGRRGSVSRSN